MIFLWVFAAFGSQDPYSLSTRNSLTGYCGAVNLVNGSSLSNLTFSCRKCFRNIDKLDILDYKWCEVMNDLWKTVRLGVYIFALPLVATAAASAHQWMTDANPVSVADLPVAATVVDGQSVDNLRAHIITQNSDGVVKGRLVSIESKSREAVGLGGLKVYFSQNGEIAKQAYTGSDGSFAIEGLSAGAYSFIASGETGFAAYGVNVIASDSKATNVMEVAAVSPKFETVRQILDNRVPAKVADEIVELAKSNTNKVSPIEVNGSNRIMINSEGELVGNVVPIFGIHQSVAGTFVHIVKNDKQIAATQVDASGHFQIPDIAPGVYDFVAAGPAGFAAVGFEAIQEGDVVAEPMEDTEVVEASIPDSASIPESIIETDPTTMVDAAAMVEPVQDVIATDIPMDAGYADGGYVDSGYVDSGFDAGYVDPGYSSSLDVCMTCPQDNFVVADTVGYACDSCGGGEVVVDSYVAPPIEYIGEAVGCGCAAGGSCGGCGSFGGYGGCCAPGGGLRGGGLLGGLGGALGGGLQTAARLGAIALGIYAIGEAIDEIDDPDQDAPPQSPFLP